MRMESEQPAVVVRSLAHPDARGGVPLISTLSSITFSLPHFLAPSHFLGPCPKPMCSPNPLSAGIAGMSYDTSLTLLS